VNRRIIFISPKNYFENILLNLVLESLYPEEEPWTGIIKIAEIAKIAAP
jgi:hypothetical protein